MKEPVFSVESLCAGYRDKIILNNISFEIESGEFVTLIGPNGAGKSTLIKTISGLIPVHSGGVSFLGRDIRHYSRKKMAECMSAVSPVTGDIPDFTVELFLSFGRFPFSSPFSSDETGDSIINDMAFRCGIEHLLLRSIKELSAGEFQLVQMARALVQNRNVLLLDEPVSNLDYRHMVQVIDILTGLHRSGSTIICALHDVNIACYSSRIIAVKNGNIYFDGVPDEVITEDSLSGLYESKFYCGKNPVTGHPAVYPVTGSSV